MKDKTDITPETRIARLLEDYPELENRLINLAPAFAKLRNPILRKTVARVTNLRQAASIGNISLGTLINELRSAAGMEKGSTVADSDRLFPPESPDWLKREAITRTFDAREMIERGGAPLEIVIKELNNFSTGEIYELITPFLPAPMIDMFKVKGFEIWADENEPENIKTYFRKMKDF